MNTRTYPRTMQAAFGPYTDDVLYEPPQAVFNAWLKWRKEHAKPVTAESYQPSINEDT